MSADPIASVFRELRRSGQLELVLRVLRDALTQYRMELDKYLVADLLADHQKQAAVFALQGQMKTCVELLATFTTLAEDVPAVREDEA